MRTGSSTSATPGGDADVSALAPLIGEPSRMTLLMALVDGRALSASVLAAEAGLSSPATSAHLSKLLDGGLVTVQRCGRHRYYTLAGPDVADLVEALARLTPAQPVRSLRQGTRAHALRAGRTCYDHLAGQLGVAITAALVERAVLVPGNDAPHRTMRRPNEPPVGSVPTCPYRLGPAADDVLAGLGVDLPALRRERSRRALLRVCIDWSEQRHHLAGRLGAALTSALLDHHWITRHPGRRAVALTARGEEGLRRQLGVELAPSSFERP